MAVLIRDVAARAQVSVGIVSQVLNDRTEVRVAEETRVRIRKAARELGYQPNRFARGLSSKRPGTIGVMLAGLRNPFFVSVLESAEAVAASAGYQALFEAAPYEEDSESLTTLHRQKLRGWPVDGVLLWDAPERTLADHLGAAAERLPVVYLGYPRTDGADAVFFDQDRGARLAVAHLAHRGYRRIGYASGFTKRDDDSIESRHAIFIEACARHGLTLETVYFDGRPGTCAGAVQVGLTFAALPPAERPEAVICLNDDIAMGLCSGVRRGGLRIPNDIAIIGFDGTEMGQCLDLPLTTVLAPVTALCAHAMEILHERMVGDCRALPPQQIAVATDLLVGRTT